MTSQYSTLNDRVLEKMERVEYRLATDPGDLDEIFRLRYCAYLREGAIPPHASGRFSDDVDTASNTFIIGVYVDGCLSSSIRLSVTLPGRTQLPTAHVFPEVLLPEIAAGRIIVDPTRFVADHGMSRQLPELPYITLRIPWLAMEYFEADLMLAAVRPEHQAFYRRLWGNRVLCPARPYPNLSKPVALTALDYAAVKETVHRRYPFFRSTAQERHALFGPPAPLARRSEWVKVDRRPMLAQLAT